MRYLLNLIYAVLLVLASPWLIYRAARHGKYRAGLRAKLWGLAPRRDSQASCVWIHAVSLGEVSLIGPLVAELRLRHPQWQIAVSTSTVTGYTLATTRYQDLLVFYAPLDFSWAVRRAVARLRPNLLVLVELELWPNLIAAARAAGARVAIVNGRLGDRSYRGYARVRPLVARWLRRVDVVAAQNAESARRFVDLGADRDKVHACGSLKFDGAQTNRDNPQTQRLARLAGFAAEDIVFLAGSTQEPEEQLALDAFGRLVGEFPRLRLVLVPRHPERFEAVAAMLAQSRLRWQRRSQCEPVPPDPAARILLVDCVGELAAWWGTASIAYVGGSMGPRNGQNMIEPAAYGAAVSFGPRTHNFRDVVSALLAAQAAVVVHDGPELTAFVRRALAQPAYAARLGQAAREVVAANLGAAARTVDLLEPLVAAELAGRETRQAA